MKSVCFFLLLCGLVPYLLAQSAGSPFIRLDQFGYLPTEKRWLFWPIRWQGSTRP
ncbi:MAG: hypothetical protein IPH12_16085 [Saprospirales bacterium]|nr:hypothetical protein [Saprospirales bacterium]